MEQKNIFREAVFNLTEYIAGKTIEEVKRELGLKEIIKLASNENPFGPSPQALRAIAEELPNIFMYPEKSFLDLKKVLAKANGVTSKNIVVGHGSETIIQIIPQLFVNSGDEVIVADKTYGRYAEASKLMEANIKYMPLNKYTFDLGAIAKAITPKTKIIWICNPNNPTGTIVKRHETEEFLNKVPESAVVVFDQAYFEYVEDAEYADAIDYVKYGYKNVIVLRTFSKAFGLAGLRLGYGIADESICRLLDTIKEPFNLNRLSIAAGPACLNDQEWLGKCLQENKQGREYLTAEFKELGWEVVPSQTNFILVNVKQDGDSLFQRLMAQGVIVRPAGGWGYQDHIRVTIGTMEQNEQLIRVLRDLLPEGKNAI